MWQRAPTWKYKKGLVDLPDGTQKIVRYRDKKKVIPEPVRISEMHTMQVVNAIKWCIRTARIEISNGVWTNMRASIAELLSVVPQWYELLCEAKRRKLKIVYGTDPYEGSYTMWYQECMEVLAMKELENR